MDTQQSFSNCPKCGAEIELVNYEHMTFESCPNCHGFFLRSLEYITNKEEFEKPELVEPRADAEDLDRMKIKCPACKVPMTKSHPQHKRHLTLDICPECLGIWFDQGEFIKYRGKWTNKLFKPGRFKVKFSCEPCKVTEVSRTSRELPKCPRCGKFMNANAVGIDTDTDYRLSGFALLALLAALTGLYFLSARFLTHNQALLLTALTGAASLIGLSFFLWRKLNDDFFPGPFIFPYR